MKKPAVTSLFDTFLVKAYLQRQKLITVRQNKLIKITRILSIQPQIAECLFVLYFQYFVETEKDM